jgi:hypothetical protein
MRGNEAGIMLILKNIHLAPEDCCQLVLHEIARNKGLLPYLLVLTCEVPEDASWSSVVDMAEHCRVFAFQAECNFRSTLSRCATICHEPSSQPKSRHDECRDEDRKLSLAAVAWLHSSLLERCTYSPLSFSKRYSFSDADLAAARDTVTSLFSESIADGLTFRHGDAIVQYDADSHFHLLGYLLTNAIYGGRLETNSDHRLLDTIVAQLMDAIRRQRGSSQKVIRVVDLDESGVDTDDLPTGGFKTVELPTAINDLMGAIGSLPLSAPAAWFGLGGEAESDSRARFGTLAMEATMRIQIGGRPGSRELSVSGSSAATAGSPSAASHPCVVKFEKFRRLLPSSEAVRELGDKVFDEGGPGGRFRAQESRLLVGLLGRISTDVGHALDVLSRRRRATERVSGVISALGSGAATIPAVWSALLPQGFHTDAGELAQTLTHCVHTLLTASDDTWDLRGTLRPAGLLSALMLTCCKAKGLSPEGVELHLHVPPPAGQDAIQGVAGVGLAWEAGMGVFQPTRRPSCVTPLPACTLSWEARSPSEGKLRSLPLRWHGRTIADVRLPCAGLPEMQWLQCGAALVIPSAPRASPGGLALEGSEKTAL